MVQASADLPLARSESPASVVFITHDRRRPSVDTHTTSSSRHDAVDGVSRSDSPFAAAESAALPVSELTVEEWLRRYANGELAGNEDAPPPPRAIADIINGVSGLQPMPLSSADAAAHDAETEMYIFPKGGSGSSKESSAALGTSPGAPSLLSPSRMVSEPSSDSLAAQAAVDFYRKHGHLPAPKMALERERLKLAQKFGLDRPKRRAAIDSICRLAQRSFKVPTVVISLTFADDQVLGGEVGFGPTEPGPDEPPRRLDLEPAFCTHALVTATQPGTTFIVRDTAKDWRFRNSPYVVPPGGGGIGFYAACNVHLPTEPDEREQLQLPASLPVGALCLIDNKPRGPSDFDSDDRQTLQGFAGLIARELMLGYEQDQRQLEEKQGEMLEKFLQSTLILPESPSASRDGLNSTQEASTYSSPTSPLVSPTSPSASRKNASPATMAAFPEPPPILSAPVTTFERAALQLRKLTTATASAILDLREFRGPRPGRAGSDRAWRGGARTALPKGLDSRGRVNLLGSSGGINWVELVAQEETLAAVASALSEYYEASRVTYDSVASNPFRSVLPPSVTATLCLPIFNVDGTPALLLLLTTGQRYAAFNSIDVRFARNLGAVLIAFLLRQRAMEADRAKLAFVASISHELRTPLHGINSQVELIREFSTPSQLRRIGPLLDTADVCLESLRDVLDDTLDFAKLSQHSSPSRAREAHLRSLVKADLEQVVEEVQKAVWVRKRRVDMVKDDGAPLHGVAGTPMNGHGTRSTSSHGAMPAPTRVDLVLEVQDRVGGWKAWVDVGGLKRCLLNVIGNALKFTNSGHVKLTLREIPPQAGSEGKHSTVVFQIEDSGCGMDESFAAKAFLPFIQANPFADGAGLGLSIVSTIVQRMSGTVEVRSKPGEGTVVTLALPMTFIQPSKPVDTTPASSPLYRRRCISDELAALFTPGSPDSLVNSPPLTSAISGSSVAESAAARLNFGQAIEAAQASTKLARVPSRRKRPPQTPGVVEPSELIAEAAKLSLTTVAATMASGSVDKSPVLEGMNKVEATAGAAAVASGRRANVLVADDNRIALNILSKLFTSKGIMFTAAEDGQKAVDAYKAAGGAFNLFLADVQMPIKDGVEASVEIREHEQAMGWPRCRIVALTGLSNEEDMRNAGVIENDGPIDAWIVKGKSLRVILDEVNRVEAELAGESAG